MYERRPFGPLNARMVCFPEGRRANTDTSDSANLQNTPGASGIVGGCALKGSYLKAEVWKIVVMFRNMLDIITGEHWDIFQAGALINRSFKCITFRELLNTNYQVRINREIHISVVFVFLFIIYLNWARLKVSFPLENECVWRNFNISSDWEYDRSCIGCLNEL